MADLIDREQLLKNENLKSRQTWDGKTPEYGHVTCVDVKTIKEQPSVEAKKVVQCKDCKHSYDDILGRICSYGICVDCMVSDDFYCAYGEWKEDG